MNHELGQKVRIYAILFGSFGLVLAAVYFIVPMFTSTLL